MLHNCSQLEYIVKWFLIPIIFEPPSVKQIGSKIIVLDWSKEARFGSNYREFRNNRMWCISVFREKLSEKKCTRQSRKVIWDMINTLFLTLWLLSLLLLLSLISTHKHTSTAFRTILSNFFQEKWTKNYPQYWFRDCRAYSFRPSSKYNCVSEAKQSNWIFSKKISLSLCRFAIMARWNSEHKFNEGNLIQIPLAWTTRSRLGFHFFASFIFISPCSFQDNCEQIIHRYIKRRI